MKLQTLRTSLERLSFYLWMGFTIFSISLAGIGIEGMLFAGLMLLASSAPPAHVPLAMMSEGCLGFFLSVIWRQVGVNHFHYLQYDAAPCFAEEVDAPARVLHDLIQEVESSTGYARNDARAKAKLWLIDHAAALDEEDRVLARTHFGYLLPASWGEPVSSTPS